MAAEEAVAFSDSPNGRNFLDTETRRRGEKKEAEKKEAEKKEAEKKEAGKP